MKTLVLGALLAVASSAGCATDDGGDGGPGAVLVDAKWQFTHVADGSARSCPVGYDTAVVTSQAVDESTHFGTGQKFVDKFDCADGRGTLVLPDDGLYLVWVEIQTDGGGLYAQSKSQFIDTVRGDQPDTYEILDDGGYFFFAWELSDAGVRVSCADAGIGSTGSVDSVATSISNSSYFRDDKFTCSDHYGSTDGLVAGTYTVSITAEDSAGVIGQAPTLTNKTIGQPNGLTTLGTIIIPLD